MCREDSISTPCKCQVSQSLLGFIMLFVSFIRDIYTNKQMYSVIFMWFYLSTHYYRFSWDVWEYDKENWIKPWYLKMSSINFKIFFSQNIKGVNPLLISLICCRLRLQKEWSLCYWASKLKSHKVDSSVNCPSLIKILFWLLSHCITMKPI